MFAYPLMHPQTRFLSAWHLSPWSKSRTQVLFCCRYWYYYYNLFSTFFSMNGHVWRKQVLEKVYHQDDEEVRESRKRYAKKNVCRALQIKCVWCEILGIGYRIFMDIYWFFSYIHKSTLLVCYHITSMWLFKKSPLYTMSVCNDDPETCDYMNFTLMCAWYYVDLKVVIARNIHTYCYKISGKMWKSLNHLE